MPFKSQFNCLWWLQQKYIYEKYIYLLTVNLDENALTKIGMFFQLESFVDKTTFNFHSFNKINYFATTQDATTIFYLFYLSL